MISKREMGYSRFALLPNGLFQQERKYRHILNPLRVCEQGSHVQALLVFSRIVSEDEVAGSVSTRWLRRWCSFILTAASIHLVRFNPSSLRALVSSAV